MHQGNINIINKAKLCMPNAGIDVNKLSFNSNKERKHRGQSVIVQLTVKGNPPSYGMNHFLSLGELFV